MYIEVAIKKKNMRLGLRNTYERSSIGAKSAKLMQRARNVQQKQWNYELLQMHTICKRYYEDLDPSQ